MTISQQNQPAQRADETDPHGPVDRQRDIADFHERQETFEEDLHAMETRLSAALQTIRSHLIGSTT